MNARGYYTRRKLAGITLARSWFRGANLFTKKTLERPQEPGSSWAYTMFSASPEEVRTALEGQSSEA